jgi:hypothetical protein
MFGKNDRGKRLEREAKAISRKALRNGYAVSGRDQSRLNRVRGSIVKYGLEDDSDDSRYDSYREND